MTTREIATKMLKLMSKRVGSSLRDMRDKSRIASGGAGGMYQTCALVR